MSDEYTNLGIRTVVNATGTKTRIGGSRIRPEALDAMAIEHAEAIEISEYGAPLTATTTPQHFPANP